MPLPMFPPGGRAVGWSRVGRGAANMAGMGLTAVDRFEIAELLARYSAAVDDGDFAAVGALFAGGELRDAEDRVVAAGAAAVTDLFAATTQRHGSGTPETVHLVTNLVVEPQHDGSAVARSRFLVLQQVGSGALEPIVTGRYVDRLERDQGEWVFRSRRMEPAIWGDVARHLTFDPSSIGS